MPKNYYRILGINKDATAEEIRKAYRRLSHLYHPDKDSETSDADKFIEVNEAYKVLHDPDNKRDYDHSREEGNVPVNSSGMVWEENHDQWYGSNDPGDFFIEIDDYLSRIFDSFLSQRHSRPRRANPPDHIHYDDLVR